MLILGSHPSVLCPCLPNQVQINHRGKDIFLLLAGGGGCGPVACVQWPDYGLAGCGPGRAWPSSQMNGCNYTTEVITLALFPLSVALPASPRKGGFGFVLQCNFFVGTGFFGNSQTGYLCYGHSFPGTQSGNYTARGRLQMGLFFSGHAFCEVDEKSSVF